MGLEPALKGVSTSEMQPWQLLVPSLCSFCTLHEVPELQVNRALTMPPFLGTFHWGSSLSLKDFMAGGALDEKFCFLSAFPAPFWVLLAWVTVKLH